jgi:hypothetical protein
MDSTRRATPSDVSRSKLTLSRDGCTMAWIGYAERAHIWDTRRDGDDVKMLASDATAVSVSPAGTLVAVGQRSGLILVYDTASSVERAALALSGEIMGIDWHPSLPLLACVDAAGYCYLFEVFIP